MDLSLLKRPSAYLPVVLSLVALALVAGYVAFHGIQHHVPPHDERAPARIYQLLMVLQPPIMLFFAAKYLPREPRSTAIVLALQVTAACAAWATLYFFETILGGG